MGGGGGPTGTGPCPEMRGLTPNVAGGMEDWRGAMDDAGARAALTLSEVTTQDFVFGVVVSVDDNDVPEAASGMLLQAPPTLPSLISRTPRSLGRFSGGEESKGGSQSQSRSRFELNNDRPSWESCRVSERFCKVDGGGKREWWVGIPSIVKVKHEPRSSGIECSIVLFRDTIQSSPMHTQ